ncbi:tectonic [Contarinia nasturtii]|uniref:tectonic n=1 Tax=Contarinia nasturtii TaxID=265458 RepID=UPI0012D3D574|nr:tectonic [Contarinia nasturtii]
MSLLYWKLFLVLCTINMIEAGVKIEISRFKDSQRVPILSTNVGSDNISKIEAPKMTTPVEITTKSTVDLNILKTTTSSLNSTNTKTKTTLNSQNVTATSSSFINNTSIQMVSNTSHVYNVSLMPPTDLNPYLSEFTRREIRRRFIPSDYYCPCDLKINFCDINCCCDIDCASTEIMQTLKCNERDWSIHDYEESSELQLCSQSQQFSLFCIVEGTRRRKQTRKRSFKTNDVNMLNVVQYRWPNQYDDQVFTKSDYREHYIFGDPILVWDEALEEIQFFDVPWPLYASNCRIKYDLKHLVDDETKCVQTFEVHDQFIFDFQTKLKSVKVLKYRKPLYTTSAVMKDFCKSIQAANQIENCIFVNIYHCIDVISMRTCTQDTNSTTTPISEFGENFISDQISIHIHHNFTNLLNVTAFFVYSEFNSESPITQILQKISLEYLEINETFATRDVHQVSGNIGYLPHKPIIVSKFIQPNDNVGDNMTQVGGSFLAYFHNETRCTNNDHFLKVPTIGANGDCMISNSTFQTVNFYENTRVKCNVILGLTEFNETNSNEQPLNFEQNNTYICRKFQRNIFDHLIHNLELKNANSTVYNQFISRISEMGNPRNDTLHWLEFKIIQPPNLDDIVATGVEETASEFICSNMVLGVRYEFFYGTMAVGKISNQALIKVAQIQFGNRINLKIKLDEDVLKVPIYIDVMFYDLSRSIANGAPQLHQIFTSHIHILIVFVTGWLQISV